MMAANKANEQDVVVVDEGGEQCEDAQAVAKITGNKRHVSWVAGDVVGPSAKKGKMVKNVYYDTGCATPIADAVAAAASRVKAPKELGGVLLQWAIEEIASGRMQGSTEIALASHALAAADGAKQRRISAAIGGAVKRAEVHGWSNVAFWVNAALRHPSKTAVATARAAIDKADANWMGGASPWGGILSLIAPAFAECSAAHPPAVLNDLAHWCDLSDLVRCVSGWDAPGDAVRPNDYALRWLFDACVVHGDGDAFQKKIADGIALAARRGYTSALRTLLPVANDETQAIAVEAALAADPTLEDTAMDAVLDMFPEVLTPPVLRKILSRGDAQAVALCAWVSRVKRPLYFTGDSIVLQYPYPWSAVFGGHVIDGGTGTFALREGIVLLPTPRAVMLNLASLLEDNELCVYLAETGFFERVGGTWTFDLIHAMSRTSDPLAVVRKALRVAPGIPRPVVPPGKHAPVFFFSSARVSYEDVLALFDEVA